MSETLNIGGRLFRPVTADTRREKKPPTLRQIIERKHGSLTNAGKAWGVTRAAVHNYASGKRRMPEWIREDLGID